jgi:hypothetical protein
VKGFVYKNRAAMEDMHAFYDKAMASLNVVVDEDVIYEEGRALRICDESIEMIIEAFRKAGQRRFSTMNKFPVDFLERRLKEIADEGICE